MKNLFSVEVNLCLSPIWEYEWDKKEIITGIKATRVSSKTIKDILTYDTIIDCKDKILLLCDTKTSIMVKLDRDNKVIRRSYLSFKDDINVCEFTNSIKEKKMIYNLNNKRVIYTDILLEEESIKNYLLNYLNNSNNDDESKYLYYLYFNNIKDYSKEKLLNSIKNNVDNNYYKLYDFLNKAG